MMGIRSTRILTARADFEYQFLVILVVYVRCANSTIPFGTPVIYIVFVLYYWGCPVSSATTPRCRVMRPAVLRVSRRGREEGRERKRDAKTGEGGRGGRGDREGGSTGMQKREGEQKSERSREREGGESERERAKGWEWVCVCERERSWRKSVCAFVRESSRRKSRCLTVPVPVPVCRSVPVGLYAFVSILNALFAITGFFTCCLHDFSMHFWQLLSKNLSPAFSVLLTYFWRALLLFTCMPLIFMLLSVFWMRFLRLLDFSHAVRMIFQCVCDDYFSKISRQPLACFWSIFDVPVTNTYQMHLCLSQAFFIRCFQCACCDLLSCALWSCF